jgi:eukaryotic-like serine/threonine-protein kinase
MNELDLFAAAIAIADSAEQDSFLDRECVGRPELRARINQLICVHRHSHSILDRPVEIPAKENYPLLARTVDLPNRDLQPGYVFAEKYKLLEQIGEGGMGEVWVADQMEPIKRRIAIKLIKPGMDSRSVLARFEAERQALAVMDHPNIAKVLDAGTAVDGRPYFVMELVKGTPITDFADARKLTTKQRLELFVPVCQAIQHAHTKGIIHRDIKPSNVLVALHDEQPVPKVIDFGVAKAMGQQLTEKTIYTGFGVLVGTPTYMAPEQATFNQLDIDTRADVYALGVLLYELLAGSPPVEAERLKKAALDEMLRLVREEEPPRPSQRLSTSRSRASIAAVRQTEPEKLSKLIRGELDWIVMKALEKDRTRRYETANGFAADVLRYLAGESVQAVPPSGRYRLNKFVKRHKARVIGATAFLLLLVTSVIVSGWLAVVAKRAEGRADAKRLEAEENAERASAEAMAAFQARMEVVGEKVKSDIHAQSLEIDLDLIESRTDSRVGILRLARPRKDHFSSPTVYSMPGVPAEEWSGKGTVKVKFNTHQEWEALREFVTAAVLATGQNYAPLLPPKQLDGGAYIESLVSDDGERVLTLSELENAWLWDQRTGKSVAQLLEGNERVVSVGFSPNGKTAYTQDYDSVVRIWDAADGKLRWKTESRADRYVHPHPLSAERLRYVTMRFNHLVVTDTRVLTQSEQPIDLKVSTESSLSYQGTTYEQAELWDTMTGERVATLGRADRKAEKCNFGNSGEWITTAEDEATGVIYSAKDGCEHARLIHSPDEVVQSISVSPNGRRCITSYCKKSETTHLVFVRLWEASPLRQVADPVLDKVRFDYSGKVDFSTDEYVYLTDNSEWSTSYKLYRLGLPESLLQLNEPFIRVLNGELLIKDNTQVFDVATFKRLHPPSGRKYHPALKRIAPDGRFVSGDDLNQLIDTNTEKSIPTSGLPRYLPNYGWILWSNGMEVRLPPPKQLNIPGDLLELWAQVAVRGELGPDGSFVKWKEETWESKRQELAALPAPHPDFPFPGYVATDKLHWLRAEYDEATSDVDKHRLAADLLRRADETGDRTEAARWRAEQERLSKLPGQKK